MENKMNQEKIESYEYIVTMVDGRQIPFHAPNYDQAAKMVYKICEEYGGNFFCFTSNDKFEAMVSQETKALALEKQQKEMMKLTTYLMSIDPTPCMCGDSSMLCAIKIIKDLKYKIDNASYDHETGFIDFPDKDK